MHNEPATEPARPKVLVVEDEPLIRLLLADELRAEGFVVVEASNGLEALAFFSADPSVDLVFSDIKMPGGLDGVQLADRLRALHPNMPIILTSGNAPPISLDKYGTFIPKPYLVREAVEIVAAMFSGRGKP